mgnify:CR=1 FL=1
MNNYIEQGDKIQCPKCGAIIGTFNTHIIADTPTEAKIVDFEPKQQTFDDEPMRCKKCGKFYFDEFGLIHLEGKGWVGAR